MRGGGKNLEKIPPGFDRSERVWNVLPNFLSYLIVSNCEASMDNLAEIVIISISGGLLWMVF